MASIRKEVPSAKARFELLDLASLESVVEFASRLRSQQDSLDLLVNNAAVMMLPKRQETRDGIELQFGTNYLGHFALTAHLLPLLRKKADSRVVTLSSIASRHGMIDFNDLQAKRNYRPMTAYSQSKLACLMFALELQRRSEEGGWGISSMAAHPGVSRTDLLANGPGRKSLAGLTGTFLSFLFQPVSRGALPVLFAGTDPDAEGGGYYGPSGFLEVRGSPARAIIPGRASDLEVASRLWEISGQLSGASFPEPA